MVQILPDRGINVNAQAGVDGKALQAAALEGVRMEEDYRHDHFDVKKIRMARSSRR